MTVDLAHVPADEDDIVYEVELLGWLPKAIDAETFVSFQERLGAGLAEAGYTDVVLGSAATRECLKVRLTAPMSVTSLEEARRVAMDDVTNLLEKLGCRLSRKLQWESVRELVPALDGDVVRSSEEHRTSA